MNKRLNPLTENHLFTKSYRNGISDVNKLCAVYIMKNIHRASDGSPLPTKMGIAVNAKLGGAVQRNRVKRIIREGYCCNLDRIKPGLIIVVAARGAAFARSCKSFMMAKAIDTSLSNLGAYKDQSLKKPSEIRIKGKSFKNQGNSDGRKK